uniref:Uncharacterized protein n=1 Tax=viral metagenome TaxID=1070528 RepID=A0A6H1ZI16_9ZZZZ
MKKEATKKEVVLIKDVEREYKMNFGVRGDMKVGTYLKRTGLPSLALCFNKILALRTEPKE